ncbi:hypothetical protein ACWFQ8_27230 [Streptomyces sp. NPDC055254]
MSETRHPRSRRRRPLRAAVGLLVLMAVAGYFVVQRASNGGGAPYCTASAAVGAGAGSDGARQSYEMTTEQAANAATIAAVGIAKGLPDRAVTIALATAMQESSLRNIDHGDRDSLGLFQQRPSQGWGTPEQIMDPVYSAGIFYDHLVDVPGYSRLPLTVAAQKVQRSGYPQAYAKHEPDASVLTAAFGESGSLSCSGPAPAPGDPAKVRTELARAFGKDALAGEPDGESGAAEVSVRPKQGEGPGAARRGRAMAHWAVARAQELGIARVSYGGQGWIGGQARGQWRPGAAGGGTTAGAAEAPGNEIRIVIAR